MDDYRAHATAFGQQLLSALTSLEMPKNARVMVLVEIDRAEDDVEQAIMSTVQQEEALDMLERAMKQFLRVIGEEPEEIKTT